MRDEIFSLGAVAKAGWLERGAAERRWAGFPRFPIVAIAGSWAVAAWAVKLRMPALERARLPTQQ